MHRKPAIIICDANRAPVPAADAQELNAHHRYYGASAINGGERMVETRRGRRPRAVTPSGV